MTTVIPFAARLEGLVLPGEWRVEKRIDRKPGMTGGHFSIGYLAEHSSGKKGFVKAIDFSSALSSTDFAGKLRDILTTYTFERDLCVFCASKYMKHVVIAVAHGTADVEPGNVLAQVPFIVFELADCDIRRHLSALTAFDLPWALRMLHQMAIGIQQLHIAGIAHQDVKPSNILMFGVKESKIADLGRAFAKGTPAPHDGENFAGDYRYAPPEYYYGYVPPEENARRYGADLYMLGNMVVFMFSQTTFTALMHRHLHEDHHFNRWKGDFKDVLPYLRQAFDAAVMQLQSDFPEAVREELTRCIAQLCEPDPSLRGHPEERGLGDNRYSVQRFVSLFDLLATRCELANRRSPIGGTIS